MLLVGCHILSVSPHLLTVFSMMHTYAGLSIIALIIAFIIDQYGQKHKMVSVAFVLFLLSSIICDKLSIAEDNKRLHHTITPFIPDMIKYWEEGFEDVYAQRSSTEETAARQDKMELLQPDKPGIDGHYIVHHHTTPSGFCLWYCGFHLCLSLSDLHHLQDDYLW